jgi:hypothetical protein
MTKRPAKKNVSPVVATVVIAVVLALVVVVYLKFGKGPTGWQADTKEGRQLLADVEKKGGWKGFGAKMRAMRERRGGGRRGREGRRRGPAPTMERRGARQAPTY